MGSLGVAHLTSFTMARCRSRPRSADQARAAGRGRAEGDGSEPSVQALPSVLVPGAHSLACSGAAASER